MNWKQKELTVIALIVFVVIGMCHYLAWPPIRLHERVWRRLGHEFVPKLRDYRPPSSSADVQVGDVIDGRVLEVRWHPYLNWTYPQFAMIPDVRIPWFVLGVIYAGLFFLLADRKAQ